MAITVLPPKEHIEAECGCLTPPLYGDNFNIHRLAGYDETKNRFGEVSIETCKQCGTKWLHYFVEYEAFRKSGRWYRGVITDEVSLAVTPQNSVAILEGLDWWVSGGSYFNGIIKKGHGHLKLSLY